MNRLLKFIEEDTGAPARIAYAFGAERLPPSQIGRQWQQVDGFSAAEELLANGDLKAVFQKRSLKAAQYCQVTSAHRPARPCPVMISGSYP
jgi:hypothetical protein